MTPDELRKKLSTPPTSDSFGPRHIFTDRTLALHDAEVEARVWLTASSMTKEREKAAMRIANRQEKSDVAEWVDKRAKSESVASLAHIAMELNFLRGEFEAKAKEAEGKAR